MDNIHNDELSGGSKKGYIDDRMGANKNKGIQNKKAKYNQKNNNSSLSTNICGKSEKNAQKSHEKDRQQCNICRKDIDGSFVCLNLHRIKKKELICDHKFHKNSITNYMRNKADSPDFFQCPNCRQLFQSYKLVVSKSELDK